MKEVTVEILQSNGQLSVYINDYRVAGSKPRGGGNVIASFKTQKKDIDTALKM